MKRMMMFGTLIAAALVGTACKNDPTEKAGEAVQKSVEKVDEKAQGVRDEMKDVTKEQKDVKEEQGDVAQKTREMNQAQGELATARQNYSTVSRERLAKLDAQITELEGTADAKAKEAAIALRARRDALASKLDSASARTDAEWNDFKRDVDDSFKTIEDDIGKARN